MLMYTVKLTGNFNLHMKKQHVKDNAIMQTVHAQVLVNKIVFYIVGYS